jgi:hypothetical protein
MFHKNRERMTILPFPNLGALRPHNYPDVFSITSMKQSFLFLVRLMKQLYVYQDVRFSPRKSLPIRPTCH